MTQLIFEGGDRARFDEIVARFGLQHQPDSPLALVLTESQLELRKCDEPKLGAITVDFIAGAMAHRRRFGGGRGEAVAKAVGIKKGYVPSVVDATAGLGRDAFVLASVGCHVTMLERHPVVAALLFNGLERAYQDAEMGAYWREHLVLRFGIDLTGLRAEGLAPNVVYLDPMFPHRQKSALVKKEMRVFQSLVGADEDADALLQPARQLATKRVVVKRPDYAGFLADEKPQSCLETKSHRFDFYLPI